mmetsp:Transcript_102336/g.164959  ORF Transcript_102336/g.164959 Transcript_102336/m.164959 type:complete len:98 (+) Transcript_102336:163-456(+)
MVLDVNLGTKHLSLPFGTVHTHHSSYHSMVNPTNFTGGFLVCLTIQAWHFSLLFYLALSFSFSFFLSEVTVYLLTNLVTLRPLCETSDSLVAKLAFL